MKGLILLASIFSATAFATDFEGVQLNCFEKAQARMSKNKRMGLVSVCRDRQNPIKEHYTFGDGSSLTGFTAHSDNSCKFDNWWDGQDDQDQIDQDEWKADCLTSDDFKKPAPSNESLKTNLNSRKIGDNGIVSDSRVYTFVGSTKGKSTLQQAEAVGKQLRHEYYTESYQVDGYSYKESTLTEVKKLLATSEGDFTKLSSKELSDLDGWYENHSVKAVVIMNLETNYMSGTGLEQNMIFIPTESYEPVLVVRRFYYAE